MTMRLVTLAFDPSTGTFPEDPLADLDGDVLSVVEHFFFVDSLPYLLLVVYLRDPREARPPKARQERRQTEERVDPRAELSPDEKELYERIRAWRQARAETDHQPPYAYLTNKQVADVARRRPGSLAALKEISGIGDAKVEKFGRDLIELVGGHAS